MPVRLALFGGSFNPIHLGHLITARSVAERLNVPRVALIPAAVPPHKGAESVAPAEHRLAMARLAAAGDALFDVSDIELCRPGPSYTFDTVTHFRGELRADAELFWLIGADTLPELASWHRVDELVRIVRIITMTRRGEFPQRLDALESRIGTAGVQRLLADRLDTPVVEISASDIRARLAAGRSVRYLTPDPVIAYIQTHGLYGRT